MNFKGKLYRLLHHLPYFGRKLKLLDSSKYVPGHFYSPVPDMQELLRDEPRIFNSNVTEIPGIDLNSKEQVKLLEVLSAYYREIPYDFANPDHDNRNLRYRVKDAAYRYSDVVMLYSMMRHFKPGRIVEVGSGYSSAVMLDTNDLFLNGSVAMTFIDPDTARLEALLRPEDSQRYVIHKKRVQDVDPAVFSQLKDNDILFIDSSHVMKTGSDLNYLLFEVLPLLNTGVLVHFHDIHFPFEYPRKWIMEYKWIWNENYALRAFLMYNSAFRIIHFNSFLHRLKRKWFEEYMPDCLIGENETGSIWIKKEE
jgi:predicted O-methyltransferase YrrM